MAPAIPDRWLDYTPVGKIIKGTRFIAFKVPLREHIVESVKSDTRLNCKSLLDKIPNLGMIIDLTNTTRYYDPRTFRAQGIHYEKLLVPGHEIPKRNSVERFKMLANRFLQQNANNVKLIGVHCTHGVNRTGYLISSYMISEMKMTPPDAIKRVEDARGHAIERQNYRDHLLEGITNDYNNMSQGSKLSNYRHTYISNNRANENWRVPQPDFKKRTRFDRSFQISTNSGRHGGPYNRYSPNRNFSKNNNTSYRHENSRSQSTNPFRYNHQDDKSIPQRLPNWRVPKPDFFETPSEKKLPERYISRTSGSGYKDRYDRDIHRISWNNTSQR